MTLLIERITPDAFAPFGRVLTLAPTEPPDARVVRTDGAGWTDAYTHDPLLSTNGSLGMTRAAGMPFSVERMERHPNSEEALFPSEGAIVLVVAPAGAKPDPDAADLRAFAILPGTVAVMKPGTWHDACRGLDGPTAYFWMCTVRTGTDWRQVAGGPVPVGGQA